MLKKEETQATISSELTEADETQNNFLEEYEIVNDSFKDEDPE